MPLVRLEADDEPAPKVPPDHPIEKLLRAGHSILELPIRFEPRSRAQGKKIGWRDGVHALVVLVKYRFPR